MKRLPHFAIFFAAVLLVAADKKTEKVEPSPELIQTWIKQLGDESFKIREKATRGLIRAGRVALGAVTKATKSKDLEAKQHALRIINQISKHLKEAAIAFYEKRGGEVTVDETSPDKPVIMLGLNDTGITDAGIVHLKGFTKLQVLKLYGYIIISDEIGKKGFGKVVKIPLTILNELRTYAIAGNPYVFAGFSDELRKHYLSNPKTAHYAQKVLNFAPRRLYGRLPKHIKKWREANSLPKLTHHAIRRTGMEMSDEAELMRKEKESAKKLRTTTGNKRKHYLQTKVAKRHDLLADALYENLSDVFRLFPSLAKRMGLDEPEA